MTLAQVVTSSLNAAQVMALLAVFAFLICTVWSAVTRAFYSALLAFGLALAAAALLWGLPA